MHDLYNLFMYHRYIKAHYCVLFAENYMWLCSFNYKIDVDSSIEHTRIDKRSM